MVREANFVQWIQFLTGFTKTEALNLNRVGQCTSLLLIFELKRIVLKLRKNSSFWAIVLHIVFLLKIPVFKTLSRTLESQKSVFFSAPQANYGFFLSYFRLLYSKCVCIQISRFGAQKQVMISGHFARRSRVQTPAGPTLRVFK